ncbi:MAG: hypothetical protein R2762_05995 [Bryobacteraceae bacterium]
MSLQSIRERRTGGAVGGFATLELVSKTPAEGGYTLRGEARRRPLRGADWLIAAIAGLVLIAMGAWRMSPGVTGVYHDDAIYVATAKSLAEGTGYRLIDLPGSPPQTKYPILYPLLLAGIWRLWPAFPENVVAMQWVTLMAAGGALTAAAAYSVRFGYCGPAVALLIGLLFATSPETTYYSTLTMSEMPFALLTVLAFWRLERAMEARESRARGFATGLVLALPFLCRSIGIAFLVAGVSMLAWRRRNFVWTGLGAGVLAGPWVAWSVSALGAFGESTRPGYYTDYGGAWAELAGGYIVQVLMTNIALAVAGIAALPISGAVAWLREYGAEMALPLLVLGGAACASVGRWSQRTSVLSLSIAMYLGIVLVWPWPPNRFLAPLAPLLVTLVAAGAIEAGGRTRWRSHLGWLGVCVAVTSIGANIAVIREWNTRNAGLGYPVMSFERPPDWHDFERTFAWVKTNTADGEVIASGLDTMMYLYTGRRAVRPFPHRPDALFYGSERPPVGTPEQLAGLLESNGVRYVVETPMFLFSEEEPLTKALAVLRERGILKPAAPPLHGPPGYAVWERVARGKIVYLDRGLAAPLVSPRYGRRHSVGRTKFLSRRP